MTPDSAVDLLPLQRAAEALPAESIIKRLILSEPRHLERGSYLSKAEEWVRVIAAEQEAADVAVLTRRPLPRLKRIIAITARTRPPREPPARTGGRGGDEEVYGRPNAARTHR
jgi:hypothetical protein